MAKVTLDLDEFLARVEATGNKSAIADAKAFVDETIAATFTGKAVEILDRQKVEDSELDTTEYATEMFSLAAHTVSNFTGVQTGGQGGGSKYMRHMFAFETPSGKLTVRVDAK